MGSHLRVIIVSARSGGSMSESSEYPSFLSSRPVFNVHAVVGQAFEDSILMCDRALAARCSHRPFTDLSRPSVSLSAILDLFLLTT
jgi:hypothetical protein